MKLSYLLVSLLTFSCLDAFSQAANFNFTTTNNLFCSPQTVNFSSTSTGNPTQYIWNFGDGQSGGAPVENHLYDFPGTYNVSLTAVYANTASTITKVVVINAAPVVTLSADRINLCQPGNVVFSSSATGTVNSYDWDFSDATPVQTTASNSTTHNFSAYGSYNVTVKATSDAGCASTASVSVQVIKFPVSVSISPSNGCLPANATLTTTATFPPGDGLQNIVWDFGDGTANASGASAGINHMYNTTSPITTANVAVTSLQGCTNQFTLPGFAYGIPPTNTNAYTTALRDTFCGSETIQFYGFADSANSYNWSFGDGATQVTTDNLVSHKYSTLGNQQVIVTPFYNGCSGPPRILNIYITGVIASYTYVNTCSNKATYSFNNNSLGNISSYQWTYSDVPGFIETSVYSPTHTFPAVGSSVVQLTVIDNTTGCRDSMTSTIYTALPNLVTDKINVCKDSSITYTVQNSYPAGSGHTYEFHINGVVLNNGGYNSKTLLVGTHGTFNDYVVIQDGLPGTCDDTLYVQVNVRGPVIAVTYPSPICQDTAVTFINNSYPSFATDNIIKWKWDFGDGQKDSVQNPVPHSYWVPGSHSIKLEATDVNGCRLQYSGTIEIVGMPVINVIPGKDTLCQGQSSTLVAYTSEDLSWVTTNNINCTTCDTVSVNPQLTTDYIAMATNWHGCKQYDTAHVQVFGPLNLSVTPQQSSVCPATAVQFSLNTTNAATWSPPYFLNAASIPNPVSIPDTSITYTVIVKDSVGCFSDTATASIIVFPRPQVDAGEDQFLTYNASFTLTPVYGAGTQTYLWTPPGNLSCTTCASPAGIATERQQFVIEISDANSCKAKDSITIFVSCEKSNLMLPTAFTPNGDGKNDMFYPVTRGYKLIKSFTIFNRNGFKVFERKNFQPNIPSEGWDGMIKGGKTENTQAYAWVIEGICDTGMSIITKGSMLLIK